MSKSITLKIDFSFIDKMVQEAVADRKPMIQELITEACGDTDWLREVIKEEVYKQLRTIIPGVVQDAMKKGIVEANLTEHEQEFFVSEVRKYLMERLRASFTEKKS